ncbi:hypothetical protein HMPREF6745_0600 [Prevotella sp. oral taxon 472 str. F0295]|jgi:hypothetical protein|nr:hypothetical protein HMPREF6745_0600 [Prevotella sp. oral taxon 472 str. F0295]
MLGVVKWIIAYVSNAKLVKKQIGCFILGDIFYNGAFCLTFTEFSLIDEKRIIFL